MDKAYHTAKWATFFYEANVVFNVVRHPSFVAAEQATSLAWFDYEPPSYHAMRTNFIELTKKHVETEVKKTTKQSIEIWAFSSYGYSNGQDSKTKFECTMRTQRKYKFAQFCN
jgi:hypothetical protein